MRPAEPHDADAIARVQIDSWRETYTGMIPDRFFGEESFEARKSMWDGYFAAEPRPGTLAVAERGDRIVGFAFSGSARHPDAAKGLEPARELHLFSIYLLAAEHGAGIGRTLLLAVVGDGPAQLWVASANLRARSFYERNGFRADGVEVTDPDLEGLAEIRMVR